MHLSDDVVPIEQTRKGNYFHKAIKYGMFKFERHMYTF